MATVDTWPYVGAIVLVDEVHVDSAVGSTHFLSGCLPRLEFHVTSSALSLLCALVPWMNHT